MAMASRMRLQNANCRTCERGNADFDVRHNFSSSVIWMVPAGKGHQSPGNSSGWPMPFWADGS